MSSKVRRKPQLTYKSPLPGDHSFFTMSLACRRSTSISTTVTTTSSPTSKRTTSSTTTSTVEHHELTTSKFNFSPSLPLFHPLGRLAMSLPPLDAALYGLPVIQFPEEIEKSYLLSKNPPPKSTDDDNDTPVPTVSSIAAVAAREAKERPSPRKRRSGGGGGSKRKRKDPDDGDATYPAKRTRAPRGTQNHQGDDDSALDGNEGPVPESYSELVESIARRTTRSNVKTKRQSSTSSDTASVTGTPNNGVLEPAVEDASPTDQANLNPEPKIDTPKGRPDGEEREEGELSDS
ncbi:hypothetical protein CVT24_009686 [Panaeolus cyanescens]|uniref:Uncharacterized protein n=1 Tax=Panaeolus cyanescens TaxID=181874 RepID=A0A409Y9A8_9AGAR|nr:hypothetical protein CVT24_009686 [Panaeolus cyanescens]